MKHLTPLAVALLALLAAAASAQTETIRDDFSVLSYENNDGSVDWASDWIEIGENDGPAAPAVDVNTAGAGRLRIGGPNRGAFRRANLPAHSTATLSLAYKRQAMADANQYVALEISADGGGSWTELDRFAGPADDSGYPSASYDISAYTSIDTTIRFLSSPDNLNSSRLNVDFVEIEYTPNGTGTQETVEDLFNTVSYSNNDGSVDWSGDWVEGGEADGPFVGKIRVVAFNGTLRIWRKNKSLERQADLSAAVTADLSFDYQRVDFAAGDYIAVDVSSNGGATWTELDRFEGPADDPALLSTGYDVIGFAAADTAIRFRTSPGFGTSGKAYFDNVRITYSLP